MAEISEQIIREAPDIEAYKIGLLQSAKNLSQQPMMLPAYQAAPLSSLQQSAMGLATQGIGDYQPFVQASQRAMEAGIGSLGYGAQIASNVSTGYRPGMEQPYMNPYQQAVTQQSLEEMRRQADIARNTQSAQAVAAGAFGGTREGVQRAEFERGVQDLMSQRIFQDYAQNYGQAQLAARQDFDAQQQRQLQQANLFGQFGTQYGQLGTQQGALGEAYQKMGIQDVNTLATLGATQQQQNQAELEAARATRLQQTMAPYQQTAFLSDIYKGAPSSTMSLTGTTAPTTSPLLQAAGLGVSGLASYAGASKAGLFG
jgi:hypothetical protein